MQYFLNFVYFLHFLRPSPVEGSRPLNQWGTQYSKENNIYSLATWGSIGMYSLHIVHSLHICILCIIWDASLTLAFHARLAKCLHLVQAEQRQSTWKTQLNCCSHQRDGTNCSHQFDFRDILSLNCIFCIFCIYCIMCTSTGMIHLKKFRSALCQQLLRKQWQNSCQM